MSIGRSDYIFVGALPKPAHTKLPGAVGAKDPVVSF
jgi:hypothetical protein